MSECKMFSKLLEDIKAAMKTGDTLKRDCLRGVVSQIKDQTVNAGKELTDSICINVLKKAAKQRNDSIASFKQGGRDDLVAKEEAELKLIESYLPKMYSEEEVQTIVLKLVNDNKIPEVKTSIGRIMKLVNELPDKDLIDKKTVSRYLSVLLK